MLILVLSSEIKRNWNGNLFKEVKLCKRMDNVVHFEIPAEDVERAKEFYTAAFGWKMNSMPEMGYTIIHTVEVDEKQMPKTIGAINGGMLKRTEEMCIQSPVITISVKDIDASIDKVKQLGGKIVGEKMKVSNMGLAAYFKDPEGNVLGL